MALVQMMGECPKLTQDGESKDMILELTDNLKSLDFLNVNVGEPRTFTVTTNQDMWLAWAN